MIGRVPAIPMLVLLLLLWPGIAIAAAPPMVRSLFVGINSYPQGASNVEPPRELRGAVNDVALIRGVLAARHGLAVADMPTATDCRAERADGASLILIEACARNQAIIAGLRRLIDTSRPGDLVLFFFAGHGAYDRDTGHSTLLPWDQRPDQGGQIYDIELRDMLWRAARLGVSVVTIFDSCSSGTATRDLRKAALTRSASAAGQTPPADAGRELPPPAGAAGYLVHLAAVADDGVAVEAAFGADDQLAPEGQIDGVFTRSLAQALMRLPPRASYREVAELTAVLMAAVGARQPPALSSQPAALTSQARLTAISAADRARLAEQQAQYEGALANSFLGAAGEAPIVFAAERRGSGVALPDAGSFAGVTPGSVFTLHCQRTEAEAGTAVIGRAEAATVAPDAAGLTTAALLAPCPGGDALWVRLVERRLAGVTLRLAIAGATPPEQRRVEALLARGDLVVASDRPAGFVLGWEPGSATCGGAAPRMVVLRRRDGDQLMCVGAADAPDLDRRLATALRALASYFAVSDLVTGDTMAWARIGFGRPQCQNDVCSACDNDACRWAPGGVHRVATGERLWITVADIRRPVHVNALLLDGRNLAVQPLPRSASARDGAFTPDDTMVATVFEGRFCAPGDLAVLVLLSSQPIDIAALRQEAVRAAGGNALARLLLLAGQGRRAARPAAPAWAAQLTRFRIEGKPCR